MLDINYVVFLLPVTLVHSLIAAFPATSGLSCHAGIRGEGLAVAKTEREHEEDVGEEGRPTEDDGKWSPSYTTRMKPLVADNKTILLHQKYGGVWQEKERWNCRVGLSRPEQGSQEAETGSSLPEAASLRAAGPLRQRPGPA